MRHRLLTITAAAGTALGAALVAIVIPFGIANSAPLWGQEFTGVGFLAAVLIAWPAGTLIFTSRSRRHRT